METCAFCTIMNEFSRYVHLAGIGSKGEEAELKDSYKGQPFVQEYIRNGVKRLHTDGGGEYSNVTVPNKSETCPHTCTPERNLFSERVN